MTNSKNSYFFLIHVLLFVLLVWGLYGAQLNLWGSQLSGTGEDASKNYFTVAYHIEHDTSFMHFGGMNYPFGEHTLYTDNQPLISNTLKLFSLSPDLLPWLIFLSMLLGSLALSALFKEEGTPTWFAILGSLAIVFISPQLLRLGGHYSLGYVGLLPVVIYFLWRQLNTGRFRYQLTLMLIAYLSAFIHPYYLVMIVLFWGLSLLLKQWADQKFFSFQRWLQTVIWPVLPLLLFQLTMLMTDGVDDRPEAPYGFLHYRATWASVFLPLDFSYFKSWHFAAEQSKEGGFFIGLLAWIGIIVMLLSIARKRRLELHPVHILLFASIPVLLLATAFPFYLSKLDRLIKYLGPLQQFRGIARFAFVFFYVVNIAAVIHLGRMLKGQRKPIAMAVGTILCLVMALDVWTLRNQVVDKTSSGTAIFHDKRISAVLSDVDPSAFEAIIPLPYFHIGSENFRTPEVDHIREFAFALSNLTGLPLTAVQMSRTSLSQSRQQIQLVSFLGKTPKLLQKNEQGDYLILWFTEVDLNPYQRRIIKASEELSQTAHGFQVRKISRQQLRQIATTNAEAIKSLMFEAEEISKCETYESFDHLDSPSSFQGEGSLLVSRQDWTELIPAKASFAADTTYELSFWMNAAQQNTVNTQLWFWEYEKDREVAFSVTEVSDHITQVWGDWVLCCMPISVSKDGNAVQLKLHRDGRKIDLEIDEILLRSNSQNYFRAGSINLNNRYAEPSEGSRVD